MADSPTYEEIHQRVLADMERSQRRSPIVEKLTADCPREDCQVEYVGSASTLMGWSHTYDKRGNPLGRDPNITTSNYLCHFCGKRWAVRYQDGKEDEISVTLPARTEGPT